jgi:hypothetical protein
VTDEFDYSDYVKEAVSSDTGLSRLSRLAEDQAAAESAVARAEQALAIAKEKLKDISEHTIPNLMEELEMKEFTTRHGLKVQMKVNVRASLGSGPRKDEGISYLIANGSGAIVKQNVVVSFGRNDAAAAKKLVEDLKASGLAASFERKVEPATLSAWVREKLENGEDVPLETFGVFRQRVAKITM